jgi:CreA protein
MSHKENLMTSIKYSGDLVLSFTATDLQRTRGWYEKHLGFTHLFTAEPMGWMELSSHIHGVNLGFAANTAPNPGNSVPVFGVDDLDTTRQKLEADGVSFDGETIVIPDMVKLATFYDPDNNALMLSQNLNP